MNITYDFIPKGCISMQECNTTIYARAVKECTASKYEFVWFFVIGFFFSNVGYILLDSRVKLSPRQKTHLIDGFRFAGYILQLIGLGWFILGGYI